MPFPVGGAFADLLPPGRGRILNAGIARVDDGVVIRLEFEPAADPPGSAGPRLARWQSFFAGQHPSQLAGRDWAVELPAQALGDATARGMDEQFAGPAVAKYFTSTGNTWAGFAPGRPGFDLHKDGMFEAACGGLDIRAEILPEVTLSVPAPNTIRTSVRLDVDLDDWDSFKCSVLSLLNPVAGLITVVDNGLPWWSIPIVTVALPIATIAYGLGAEDYVINYALKEAKEGAADTTNIVRNGKRSFYLDTTQQMTTPLTRDWLVIETIRGSGDQLVIGGGFTAPDLNTLPRLRGELTDGSDFWSRKDRCSSNSRWVTTATIALRVEDAVGSNVLRPDPPIRYGIDLEPVAGKLTAVGQTTWRIVADPQGVYGDPATLVHWSGVPGGFEVQVTQPAEPYRSAPYPMRFQLFTSMGVREFEIPAPPPVPRPPQTREEELAEAAERVSNCYIFSTLLTRVKALQVFWLPTPQPVLRAGQHWQVLVRGLREEERLRAWHAETGELLAEIAPYDGGLTELSLVLPADRAATAVQLTSGDAAGPPPVSTYAELAGALRGPADGQPRRGPNPVAIRQTPLYPMARIALAGPAEALAPIRGRDRLSLLVGGPDGTHRLDLDPLDPGRNPVRSEVPGTARVAAQLPVGHQRLARVRRGDRTVTELAEPTLAGGFRLVGRYLARPWYYRRGGRPALRAVGRRRYGRADLAARRHPGRAARHRRPRRADPLTARPVARLAVSPTGRRVRRGRRRTTPGCPGWTRSPGRAALCSPRPVRRCRRRPPGGSGS